MHVQQLLVPAGAAFVAGAMNSVAGGGSFVSFPSLIFAGVPPIIANATNNAAMWVGTVGSARGYKEEIAAHRAMLRPIIVVSVIGALIGSVLLLVTPATLFQTLIPWLLLFATAVFAVSPWLVRKRPETPTHSPMQLVAQFFVSVYGGYFGAGIGILMLAVLAFSGLPSLNAANGVKSLSSAVINGVALIPFALARIVQWPFAISMAVFALAGGYFGARFFRQVPQRVSRWIVIVIGVTMTILFFTKR